MKKNLLLILILFTFGFSSVLVAQNPVPNPGFENWTSGNPDNWLTNNAPGFAVPVTQASPHSGTFALKGEVVSTLAGNFSPIVSSTDMSGSGFPVNQAYATLSFYYKFNKVTTGIFGAYVAMSETGGGGGAAGQIFTSSVTSFTQASLPIYYQTTNPDTCTILFTINDTVAASPAVGNYFIIDDVALSGLVGVQEQQPVAAMIITNVQPNPVRGISYIYYSLPQSGDIKFELYDVTGKTYKTIDIPSETAGRHKIELDASDLPGGIYLLRMTAANAVSTTKVQVLK